MDVGALDYDHRSAITGSQKRTSSQPGINRSSTLANGYNADNNSTGQLGLKPQTTGYHGIGPMRAAPTGANWDDGLPRPLNLQRRTYDEPPSSSGSAAVLGRSSSLRASTYSAPHSANNSRSNLGSANSSAHNLVLSNSTTHTSPPLPNATMGKDAAANLNNPFETGNRFDQPQAPPSNSFAAQRAGSGSNNPFEQNGSEGYPTPTHQQSFSQPTPPMHQQSFTQPTPPMHQQSFTQLQPQMTSNNPFDSNNRWDNPSSNGATPTFAQGGRMTTVNEGRTPAQEKDMSEWWK
jgi:hypothetical protein